MSCADMSSVMRDRAPRVWCSGAKRAPSCAEGTSAGAPSGKWSGEGGGAGAGLPAGFHFHDLRHTGNQLAANSGATTRELMHRMGHGSMRAALIYQHATTDRDRSIADALGELVDLGRTDD